MNVHELPEGSVHQMQHATWYLSSCPDKEPQPSERGITNDLGEFTDIPEGKQSNQLIVTEPE